MAPSAAEVWNGSEHFFSALLTLWKRKPPINCWPCLRALVVRKPRCMHGNAAGFGGIGILRHRQFFSLCLQTLQNYSQILTNSCPVKRFSRIFEHLSWTMSHIVFICWSRYLKQLHRNPIQTKVCWLRKVIQMTFVRHNLPMSCALTFVFPRRKKYIKLKDRFRMLSCWGGGETGSDGGHARSSLRRPSTATDLEKGAF